MKHLLKKGLPAALLAAMTLFTARHGVAQSPDLGHISGNFQFDAQYYLTDTIIDAPDFPAHMGMNGFVNLNYTRGKISAGMRYEAYLPTLQGYTRSAGNGIPYRFARYSDDKLDVTVGTFYEQFGAGLLLRTYEEWGLGYDNSIDGARARVMPVKGLTLTGLIGKQRNAFSYKVDNLSEGVIRGFDGDLSLNEAFGFMAESKTRLSLGGSFVSRYQEDNNPLLNLPENVGAYAGRINVSRKGLILYGEMAYKINDPGTVNEQIYKPGHAALLQATYSRKGLGISVSAKRIDNFDFRSDRSADGNNLLINFLPPSTKQHTYRLATLFPYATQTTGEMGIQAEVMYKLKKGTALGGPYGTTITANFSRIHGIEKNLVSDPAYEGYTSSFFKPDELYFQDFNIDISRRINKDIRLTVDYLFFKYQQVLFKNLTGFTSSTDVTSHVGIVDLSYRIKPKHTLRTEIQHAYTKQEFGSWAMLLLEYSIAPRWFVAAWDEYNYGNADSKKRLHYPSFQAGYKLDRYRFTLGYGRQRQGVLCVGGVCRLVPASNGFTFGMTGSF